MLEEPTSLANSVDVVADTLKLDYGIETEDFYKALDLAPTPRRESGDRVPNRLIVNMWEVARRLCSDPGIGVRAGHRAKTVNFHVIGYVWISSNSLADAMERLVRYESIIDSGETIITWERQSDTYVLTESYPVPADYIGELAVDFAMSSIISLCRQATGRKVCASKLEVMKPSDTPVDIYRDLVRGDVKFTSTHNAMHFDAATFDAPLPNALPDVANATLKVADDYLRSMTSSKTALEVRKALVNLLPSGAVSQEGVAKSLFRSASTLQRQLQSEGTSYREISDDVRRTLAENYLADGQHTLGQIAFLTGFSDQSNFTRAFRRWTGRTPKRFRNKPAIDQPESR